MSTRNISWGVKTANAYGWQPYHHHVPIVLKSGSLNLLEPSGPVQACNGIAIPLPLPSWYKFRGSFLRLWCFNVKFQREVSTWRFLGLQVVTANSDKHAATIMKEMKVVNFSIQLQNYTVSQPGRPQPEGLATTVRSRYGNPHWH